MQPNSTIVQSHKHPPQLRDHSGRVTHPIALFSSIMIVISQTLWNKISHSKTLALCLLAALMLVGSVIWNQASLYYKAVALNMLQNYRLSQENTLSLQNKLRTWQKAASLQPKSDVLNLEIKNLLPSPASSN